MELATAFDIVLRLAKATRTTRVSARKKDVARYNEAIRVVELHARHCRPGQLTLSELNADEREALG